MRRFLTLFLCTLVCGSYAQKKLAGRIVSGADKKPVVAANIYLSNTSIGTTTDEAGKFSLPRFPEGKYDLVVSCIGYETYHQEMRSDALPVSIEIAMVAKTDVLQEVILEPAERDGWFKWGKIFTDNFIGTSAFSGDCRLLNREALKLRLLKKTNTVRVTADEPLQIENAALGYILTYDLKRFEFNLDTQEFIYEGFPFFTPMQPTGKRMEEKWNDNRRSVYRGSLMHFMRSIYRNNLDGEQFEVREWINPSPEERTRVRQLYPSRIAKKTFKRVSIFKENGMALVVDEKDTTNVISIDSLHYFKSVMDQINEERILLPTLRQGNYLATPATDSALLLSFDAGIDVVYRSTRPPLEYQPFLPRDKRYSPVTSDLFRLNYQPVYVFPNGSFFPGTHLMTRGYWAWWEKMCNKLPFDYEL